MTALHILQLAGPYVAIVAVFGVSIYFFLRAQASTRKSALERDETLAEMRQGLKSAQDSVVVLKAELQLAQEQFRVSAREPVKSWNSSSRRTQVLRMLRAGATAQRIAAELDISRGEVDLIVKVNSITANNSILSISA